MNKKNIVEVVIAGEVYKLISEEEEEYIQKVASYINKKILQIYEKKSAASINAHLRTLFISINIADELMKEQIKSEKLEKENDTYFKELTRLESENHILKQRVKQLQNEISLCKNELQDYINNFE